MTAGPGWRRFPFDPAVADWVAAVWPHALAAMNARENAHWWRCGGTWFAGVNLLDNDAEGRVAGGPPLRGAPAACIRHATGGRLALDAGQISVCRPGYPRRRASDSDATFRFRRDRDAAHVDGLIPVGLNRRRMLREPHGFLLALPLTDTAPGASPLALWEASHRLMASALGAELARHPVETWPDVDLTDAYHAARRRCFETCRRITLHVRPGEAYLVHRLALHGISPWQEGAQAPPEGRAIVYFRPELANPADWPDLRALPLP